MSAREREVAVVTGGNRGLGLETCRQLARRGFRVVLTSRNEQNGAAAAERLKAEGGNVTYHRLDVTQPGMIASLSKDLRRDTGAIDVLVNNAGIALDGFNAEVARQTLKVNFLGAVTTSEALLPLLCRHGRIVMVSSGMGELSCISSTGLRKRLEDPSLTRDTLVELMQSFPRDVAEGRHKERGWPSSAYRVSKVGLNAFTRILARELRDQAVLVNTVSPGWVRTDMGGPSAARGVEKGAASIVWAATLPHDGPTGGFFRDGRPIPW